MKIYKISANSDFHEICAKIGPQKTGEKIMAKKSNLHYFYLRELRSPAANILKQDALSVGAELVCGEKAILGEGHVDALLIANEKQLEILAKKEALQDFGLKELAKFIKLKFAHPKKAQIMGILNATDDSFYAASRLKMGAGIEKIEKMIEDGADFIDIGGASSRPNSNYCGAEIEFERISPLIKEIYRQNLHKKAKFSLDSFDEKCAKFALDHGFCVLNDISANLNLCKIAQNYGAAYVLMHKAPIYGDLLGDIDEFFASKLAKIGEFGFENVILDVGIGFDKSADENFLLIKHLEHFLHFAKPILIGASRKSMIDAVSKSEPENRLSGSIYLHAKALENGASIIRTHDVFETKQMIKMHEKMRNLGV